MATRRTRDDVWISLLTYIGILGDAVSQERIVRETKASERTVRETLNVAAETPLVDRVTDPDGTVKYRPGSGLRD